MTVALLIAVASTATEIACSGDVGTQSMILVLLVIFLSLCSFFIYVLSLAISRVVLRKNETKSVKTVIEVKELSQRFSTRSGRFVAIRTAGERKK